MVRIWDFPRLQIAITGALVLFGSVLWRSATALEQLILGGLAIAVAYQAYRIHPFTPIAPVQVLSSADPDPERKLRLLVANVLARNRNSRSGCAGSSAPASSAPTISRSWSSCPSSPKARTSRRCGRRCRTIAPPAGA